MKVEYANLSWPVFSPKQILAGVSRFNEQTLLYRWYMILNLTSSNIIELLAGNDCWLTAISLVSLLCVNLCHIYHIDYINRQRVGWNFLIPYKQWTQIKYESVSQTNSQIKTMSLICQTKITNFKKRREDGGSQFGWFFMLLPTSELGQLSTDFKNYFTFRLVP